MRLPKISGLSLFLVMAAACRDRGSLVSSGPGGNAGGAGTIGAAGGGAGNGGGTAAELEPPQKAHVDAVWPGAGCGKMLPAKQMQTVPSSPKGYTQFTVMGTGANLTDRPIAAKAGPRTFWVRVPADYDPQRPYRVVFIGQG